MNKDYLVSIIIPVYNVEEYITESLISALNQGFESIEYILVDDCGTDNSISIAQEIIQHHSRKDDVFIFRHEKNSGLSAARNTGMQNATGKYIFFMDSDDIITFDCIEKQVSAIKKYNADMTDFCMRVIGGRNIFHETTKEYFLNNKRDILIEFFKNKIHFSAWNKLIKRSILIDNNITFIEGILYEDWFFTFDLLQKITSIAVFPIQTYHYIIHMHSITTSTVKIEKQLTSKIRLQDHLCNYLAQCKDNKVMYYAQQRLSIYRFQNSSHLIASDTDILFKKKYFELLNDKKYKKYIGQYAFFTDMPFSIFRFLFYWPYKVYKIIVKQL